ncbi:Oxysterol-binding protein OBPa [Sporothrix curviconia]|uniref:Oxysterol-binding protein OBPa n=1 Tax=Sporothrix curviconia TaxID=1260050 RepID=A0ABP0B1L2_9PEZI
MYARGILFGKMKYELGDHSFVRCPELGLTADIEFKTKGWVGGTYNAIGGTVKNDSTGEVLYELSGLWSEEMTIKNVVTGQKELFFNAHKSKPSPPSVRPIEEQEPRESQRLWAKTAKAVKERNHELATDEKTMVEDMQREEAAARANDNVEWTPRLFRRVVGGPGGADEGEEDLEWIINAQIDGETPEAQADQILAIYPVLPGQTSRRDSAIRPIPARKSLDAHPTAAAATGDLIDVGDNENAKHVEAAAAPTAAAAAAADPAAPSAGPAGDSAPAVNNTITDLLTSTGTPAPAGPLMDFNKDLDKNLPTIKRTDTSGSQDIFHDATN